MYYIIYEALKIDSNEPAYCIMYKYTTYFNKTYG